MWDQYIDRINRAREAKGMSIDALALRTGYPADLVVPLLSGAAASFSEELNRELCEALDLDEAELRALARDAGAAGRGGRVT